MQSYFGDVWLVRLLVQRGLAAIYLLAFLVVLRQFEALLGERGLLPVPAFVKRVRFWDAPSIFCWHYSDRFLKALAWTGTVLAALTLTGLSARGPVWLQRVHGFCSGFCIFRWSMWGRTFTPSAGNRCCSRRVSSRHSWDRCKSSLHLFPL